MGFDFSGWATRNDIRCSDGRTIRRDAFKDNDGQTVPLVWNHQHNDPMNVLGHALLENRDNGVYAYCTFNDTEAGRNAKLLVEHGDVSSLSIYANKLRQNGGNVLHGVIREVSLVLAGANPGAYIDSVSAAHSDDSGESEDGEAIIYTGENIELTHSEEEAEKEPEEKPEEVKEELQEEELAHADEKKDTKNDKPEAEEAEEDDEDDEEEKMDKTIGDILEELTDEQQDVVYSLIGMALKQGVEDEEDNRVKHNVFDGDNYEPEAVLSHADMEEILNDAKRYGSLKDAVLAHGITNIDYLFPDAQTMENAPQFIKRNQDWVNDFMNGTHHTPFSRIKSIHANITADEARAKGYAKGKQKLEEVIPLLKRTTPPTTVYKKQKLDRDDVVDITDFDVVAWLKTEMRIMLNEEIARAALIGDGRDVTSDDHIDHECIRPIWTDADLYTIKQVVNVAANATDDEKAKAFIRGAIQARKNYQGTGNPTMYAPEDVITDCLLMEDQTGRIIYDSMDKLASVLRVKKIVSVPVMENKTRTVDGTTRTLMAIIVNPADYNMGADKGGAVSMFDDFDIDYNQQKYLIETRCSGALTVPYSAIAVEQVTTAG